jgi:hypothetical protein
VFPTCNDYQENHDSATHAHEELKMYRCILFITGLFLR